MKLTDVKRDDDDDDDDDGNDLTNDCWATHKCLGEDMTTEGGCIYMAGHVGSHKCVLCASEF